MKALRISLIVLLSLAAIFAVLALTAPKQIEIQRSAFIRAPHSLVHGQMSRFANFHTWSPWSDLDPNMQYTVSGPDGSTGAKYAWKGNDQVGAGEMTFTAISPERIDILLHFIEPFESTDQTSYFLADSAGGTRVTWTMTSNLPIPMNVFGMLMNMQSMIGKDFEKGLSKLKTRAEALPAPSAGLQVETVDLPARTYIHMRGTTGFGDVTPFLARHFPPLEKAFTAAGLQMAAAPSALYFRWDTEKQETDMAAALPAAGSGAKLSGYQSLEAGGKALRVAYYGPYAGTGAAHEALDAYMAANGITPPEFVVEEFVTDPGAEPDSSKWLTHVIYFIK
ncbi:MAG: SRPBCC family protein [Bacteroidia bacterium]|nr:SRPBCC family protein [Bacteroidia bacterium]